MRSQASAAQHSCAALPTEPEVKPRYSRVTSADSGFWKRGAAVTWGAVVGRSWKDPEECVSDVSEIL